MSSEHLRGRVSFAAVAVLAGGLAVLTIAMNLLLARSLDADATRVLHERMTAQLASVTVARGRVLVREPADDAALDRLGWVFAGDRELERGSASPDTEEAVRALVGLERRRIVAEAPGRVRLLAAPVRPAGGHGRPAATAVVGIDLEPYQRTEHLALIASLALDLVVLLLGAAIARRTVGAALRPVAEMSARAEEWSEHDLSRRFALGTPRDEITALAATLDGLLARLEARLRNEERLLAELAHELRTPLSGIRAEAELALTVGGGDARAALGRIVRRAETMGATVETLIAAERAEVVADDTCDPAAGLAEALDALRSAAAARGVALEVRAPAGFRVQGQAGLVARAVQPVLDNAIRHARRSVSVGISAAGEHAVIAVEDDGPGLGGADPDEIFTPGATAGAGAGLGLPLARRIARSLGGDVAAVPAAGGGARFEIRLPRRPIAGPAVEDGVGQPSAVRKA